MMFFKEKKVVFDSPKVMGILNVTPDSFSDGGQFNTVAKAYDQACYMREAGATFIDIGGESTRPGATPVSTEEELDRVIPIIEKLSSSLDIIISIDTSKSEVMESAVAAGASLINDVRALRLPNALNTAARLAKTKNVPCCIMHMKGSPATMQNAPSYKNVVEEVTAFFELNITRCIQAGFEYSQIIIDPGFGFGKTLDNNYQLLKHLSYLSQFDMPILSGTSRKSMIGDVLKCAAEHRLTGSIVTAALAAYCGASILRVHDVKETVEMTKIVAKTLQS